jgi:hypothetical protein
MFLAGQDLTPNKYKWSWMIETYHPIEHINLHFFYFQTQAFPTLIALLLRLHGG